MKSASILSTVAFLLSTASQAFSFETQVSPEDMINPSKIAALCEDFRSINSILNELDEDEEVSTSSKIELFCNDVKHLDDFSIEGVRACSELFIEDLNQSSQNPPVIEKISDGDFQRSSKCIENLDKTVQRHLIDLVHQHGFQYGGSFSFTPNQ